LKNEETKSSENEINESWGQFYDDQFLKKSMVQSFDEFIEVNDDVTDQENMTIEMFIEICNSFPCKKIDITYKINDNVSANVQIPISNKLKRLYPFAIGEGFQLLKSENECKKFTHQIYTP
jgi:hypothetical protein